MMRIDRVLLIQVDFEEFVMLFAPEVLVPTGVNN